MLARLRAANLQIRPTLRSDFLVVYRLDLLGVLIISERPARYRPADRALAAIAER